MDRKKALLVVLLLVAISLTLRSMWPMLARFDGPGSVASMSGSVFDSEAMNPQLTELRLADLELKAAEYHPGRDPFRFEVKPPPAPPKPAPAPPVQQVAPPPRPATQARSTSPPAPTPPPVDVRYLGSFGPESRKIAVFGDGTDIYNVRKGGILKQHFVVESINYESADLKYVNFPQLPPTRLAAGE